MKKIILLFTAIICLIANLSSASDHENWITYNSPQGYFEAALPQTPTTSTVEREEYTAHSVEATQENTKFRIVYSVHKEALAEDEQQQFLQSAKSMYLNSQKATDVKEHSATHDGHTGIEMTFQSDTGDHVAYRMFFAGKVLYTLTVSSNERLPKKLVEYFLDSVKLLKDK